MPHFNPTNITAGGALSLVLGFLGKLVWGAIQNDRATLQTVKDELLVIRTNHLHTLQEQSKEQTEILGKINDNLVEQNGYIRGYLQGRRSS